MESPLQRLDGIVVRGHGVASKPSRAYPHGTIEMQRAAFQQRGLDLGAYFTGTLNVSVFPFKFEIIRPYREFREVTWTHLHAPEDFAFCRVVLTFHGRRYEGLVYYPSPRTKQQHFQDASTLELLLPQISDIKYGDRVTVELFTAEILLTSSESASSV